jgi:hypothetical protein
VQKFDHNIDFEKNANFFAENCTKSPKIGIVTSTLDPLPYEHLNWLIRWVIESSQLVDPITGSGIFTNRGFRFRSIVASTLFKVPGMKKKVDLLRNISQSQHSTAILVQIFCIKIIAPIVFLLLFSMHIKVSNTQQHCDVFTKILMPWRDSSPGLLLMRWMRCPLRHASRANI